MNTVTGIFQKFTEILNNFQFYAIFPEDFPKVDSVKF